MKFLPILSPPFPSLLRETDGFDNYEEGGTLDQNSIESGGCTQTAALDELDDGETKVPIWQRPKKTFFKAPERPPVRKRKRRYPDYMEMVIRFSNATLGKEDTYVAKPQLEIDSDIFSK